MSEPVNAPEKVKVLGKVPLKLPEVASDTPLALYENEMSYPIGLAPRSPATAESKSAQKAALTRMAVISQDAVAYGLPGYFTDPVVNGNQLVSGSCAKYVALDPNNNGGELSCEMVQLVRMRIPEAGSSVAIPIEKFRLSPPPEAGADRAQLDPSGVTVGPQGDVRSVLRTSQEFSGPKGQLNSIYLSGIVSWPNVAAGTQISTPQLTTEPLASSFFDIIKADKVGTLVNLQIDYNGSDRGSTRAPAIIRGDSTGQIVQDKPIETAQGVFKDFRSAGATDGLRNVFGWGSNSATYDDFPIIWNKTEDGSYKAEFLPAKNTDDFVKFLNLSKKPENVFGTDTVVTAAAEPDPTTGKISVAGGSFNFTTYSSRGFTVGIDQGIIFTRNEAGGFDSNFIPKWTSPAMDPSKSFMLSGYPVSIVEGGIAFGNAQESKSDTGQPLEVNRNGRIDVKSDSYLYQAGSSEPKRLLDVIKKVDPSIFGEASGPNKPVAAEERFTVSKVLDLGDRWGIVGTYSPRYNEYSDGDYLIAAINKEKFAKEAGITARQSESQSVMLSSGRRR